MIRLTIYKPINYTHKVFLEHLAFGLTIPFSVIWPLQQGLSLTQVAVIQSCVLIATFLLEVPTGLIADKYGRKASLILGGLSHTVALLVLFFATNFWLFLISAFITGLAWSLISGAEEAYIHDVLGFNGKKYKKYFARVTITDESSTLIGMLVGGLIVWFGYLQLVFGIATFIMSLSIFYFYLAFPGDSGDDLEAEKVSEGGLTTLFTSLTKYVGFLGVFIALSVLDESARVLWQPRLVEVGWVVAQLGILFAVLKIFSLIGSVLAEKIRIDAKTGILLSGILGGFSLLSLGINSKYVMVVGLAVYFLAENFFRVNQSDFLQKLVPERKNAATFLSVASLNKNLVSAGINPLLALGAVSYLIPTLVILFILKVIASVFIVRFSKT